MDSREPTPVTALRDTMAAAPLNIPISVIISSTGLDVVYEDERVTVDPYRETSLVLEEHEAVVFEIADFMANGNTYRVNARYSTDATSWTKWQRLSTGCRSPVFTETIKYTLEITATPATRGAATASTTSTTVIKKKGKPENFEP